ncbi:histidine phosphatase family protein, partial [Pseudomonas aeruginosa]
IEKLESKYTAEDNILIVTHSIVKKVLINAFLQQPMDQLWTSPEIEGTSLTIVKLENGQATIEMCGDIEHMPPKNIFTK